MYIVFCIEQLLWVTAKQLVDVLVRTAQGLPSVTMGSFLTASCSLEVSFPEKICLLWIREALAAFVKG